MGITSFLKNQLPQLWSFLPSQWNQSSAWKPAIRSALTSWICLVLLLIEPAARALGNAPFFLIIISFMIPPALPFLASLEVIFTTLFLVHLTWGWGVIGCAIASAVRGDPSPQRISRYSQRYAGTNLSQADLQQRLVFDGLYLDSKSSVVFGVFLGVAIGCLAWLRITDAPKFALPSVLASILAIIVCSYGALIPTFHQSALLGTYFSYPSLTYAAVAITVSAVVFPESVQHKFLSGLASTLDGIQKVTAQQYPMLSTPPSSDEFTKFKVTSEIRADAAIKYQSVLMLKANLTREFSYSKWSGNDCKTIEACVRRLLLRAGGLQVFYDSIRTWQDRYRRNVEDQEGEKAKQALHEDQVEDDGDAAGQRTRSVDSSDTPTPLSSIHSPGVTESREQPDLEKQEHHTSRHHLSNHPLDLLKKSLHNQHQQHHHSHHGSKVKPVGIFETLTRANLEGRMLNPLDREWLNDTCQRLGPASQRLLEACESSINASSRTIRQTNKQRVWTALGIHFDLATYTTGLLGHEETSGSAAPKWSPATLKTTHEELKAALEEFRTTKRHAVIDPYRPYFEKLEQLQKDDATELTLESLEPPPHRALFYCLLFEFQLIEFAVAAKELSHTLLQLGNKDQIRLHRPRIRKVMDFFRASPPDDAVDEDAPESLKGLVPGEIGARDPDARPPSNPLHYIIRALSRFVNSATEGNLFYAIRTGILVVLVTLPQFFDSTARFYYMNRGIWVSIMTVFTYQRWSGDTSLQWLFRTVGTSVGVAVGCVIWYIGTGGARFQPYGLAVVCAVTWPFIFLYRVAAPPTVMVAIIILTVSIGLVVGYSIIDTFGGFTLANPGTGWEITWRRFLLVMIGLTASYLASFLPRPESARTKVRLTLAQCLDSLGDVYTELVSFAAQRQHSKPDMRIVRNLITINNKLRVSVGQRMASAPLELKSGPWPQKTYQTIQKTSLEISDLLGQLMVVYLRSDKDEEFRRGLLLRTRFLDPSFIGEVSSALWMISQALRHGSPLPHVSIAPLEARLSTAAMGLLVPKMVNPAISSSVSITGDSLRDALLHNITRGGGRRRRGFAEASEDVPTSLVNVHRSRPRFEERDDYFTPGAQTPIHTGSPMQRRSLASSHPTIAVNSQAVGSPPGSIGLTPVATRNDASGHATGISTPHFPLRSKDQLSLEEALTFETLQDENYMLFSAGISLSFSLIRRIDALMLLTKELVGEAYRVRNLPKDAVEGRYTLHV